MRFRKSIKLFPGVKINLSKSGISTSLGPAGATVNLKPGRPAKLTTGLPGTGLSHTETLGDAAANRPHVATLPDGPPPPILLSVISTIWSITKLLALGFLAIVGVILLVVTLGGSSKTRK